MTCIHFNCPICSRESTVEIAREFFYSITCNEICQKEGLKYSSRTECCLFFFGYHILIIEYVALRKSANARLYLSQRAFAFPISAVSTFVLYIQAMCIVHVRVEPM